MDFDALLDFSAGETNEAEKARRLQRSEAEIARLTLPESVTDNVARAQLCFKGQPQQRLAAINNVLRLLVSVAEPLAGPLLSATSSSSASSVGPAAVRAAEDACDKLLPSMTTLLAGPDSGAAGGGGNGDRIAVLRALSAVCRTRVLSATYVCAKVVPPALRVLSEAPLPTAGSGSGASLTGLQLQGVAPPEDAIPAAVEVLLTVLEADLCTLSSATNEVLPSALSLAQVSNAPWQRCVAGRLMAALLVHQPPSHRTYVDTLLSLCQDVDSGVRQCMASLLVAIIPAIAGPSRRATFAADPSASESKGLPPQLRYKERALDELVELLDDEDTQVRAAAIRSAIAVYDSGISGVPTDVRRGRILPRLRRAWEAVSLASEPSPLHKGGMTSAATAAGDKDDLIRAAILENAGWLLYCGAHQSDIGSVDVTFGSGAAAAAGGLGQPSRAGSVKKGRGGLLDLGKTQDLGTSATAASAALAATRRRSMTNRKLVVDGGGGDTTPSSAGGDPPAVVLASLGQYVYGMSGHGAVAMRTTCAYLLPGMFITCLQAMGPIPLPPTPPPTPEANAATAPRTPQKPTLPAAAKVQVPSGTPPSLSAGSSTGPGKMTTPAGLYQQEEAPYMSDLLLASLGQGTPGPAADSPAVGKAAVFAACVKDSLLPCLYRLVSDSHAAVRAACVPCLVHVAAALGHERASRLLSPLYIAALQDESPDVLRGLIDTAHAWLPLLCPAEAGLRLTLYSILVPLLFHVAATAVVQQDWRRQMAWLAALRTLPLVFPAPHVAEAALTCIVGFLSKSVACRPVQLAAVHTLLWYNRHGATGRVRTQVKDYIVSKLGSSKSVFDAVSTLIQQSPTLGVTDQADKGGTPLLPVAAGVRLPLPALVNVITTTRVPPSVASTSGPVELLGPAWRRLLCIEACSAALWLYSRAHVSTAYLPPIFEAALHDPTPAVRLAAVRALPGLRTWFVLPADSAVIGRIVSTLDKASGDSHRTVSKAAKEGLACLRKLDGAVMTALADAYGLTVNQMRPLLCEQFSPSLRQEAGSSSAGSKVASAAPGGAQARRRSSISAAPVTAHKDGAASGLAQNGHGVLTREDSGALPAGADRFASLVLALTFAQGQAQGQQLTADIRQAALTGVGRKTLPPGSVPAAVYERVDGFDALASSSAVCRNPFRPFSCGPMPCLPTAAVPSFPMLAAGFPSATLAAAPDDSSRPLERLAVYSHGLLPLDDVIGLGTGASMWSDACRASEGAAWIAAQFGAASMLPYASVDVVADRAAKVHPDDDLSSPAAAAAFVTSPVTGSSLGRLAIVTGGHVPAVQTAVALRSGMDGSGRELVPGPWKSCVAWHPYSCPARVSHYIPLQLCAPAPHSQEEEVHRLASEAALLAAARSEDDVERRRVMEERKKDRDSLVLNATPRDGSDKEPGPVFNPNGWPAALVPALTTLSLAGSRMCTSAFPVALAYAQQHAPRVLSLLPSTLPSPHLSTVSVEGMVLACNGPAAVGGITTSVGPSGGQSMSVRLSGIQAGAAVKIAPSVPSPVRPAGPAGGVALPPGPPAPSSATGGAVSFSTAVAFCTLTPAFLSSILISLQPQLIAHPHAVHASGSAGQVPAGGVRAGQGTAQPDAVAGIVNKVAGSIRDAGSVGKAVASVPTLPVASTRQSMPAPSFSASTGSSPTLSAAGAGVDPGALALGAVGAGSLTGRKTITAHAPTLSTTGLSGALSQASPSSVPSNASSAMLAAKRTLGGPATTAAAASTATAGTLATPRPASGAGGFSSALPSSSKTATTGSPGTVVDAVPPLHRAGSFAVGGAAAPGGAAGAVPTAPAGGVAAPRAGIANTAAAAARATLSGPSSVLKPGSAGGAASVASSLPRTGSGSSASTAPTPTAGGARASLSSGGAASSTGPRAAPGTR